MVIELDKKHSCNWYKVFIIFGVLFLFFIFPDIICIKLFLFNIESG